MNKTFLDEVREFQKTTCSLKSHILFDYHQEIEIMIKERLPLTGQHVLIMKKIKEKNNNEEVHYKVFSRHVNKYFPELLQEYGFKYSKRLKKNKPSRKITKTEKTEKEEGQYKPLKSIDINIKKSDIADAGTLKDVDINEFKM